MTGIDNDLINRCRRSDERSLHLLYHQTYSLMKGIVLRYVFDRADVSDVINRSFVKVVKGLDKYDQNQPFAPWMSTVVIHESLDYVRRVMREKPKRLHVSEGLNGAVSSKYDWNTADRQMDADSLLSLLHELPPKTKLVFNLFAIDGYSHDEIAKKLSISTGTTKWHVSKARELLKASLEKLNNEEQLMS